MSNLVSHCSLHYHEIAIDQLDAFAVLVKIGIFDNATTFATPPITKTAFEAIISTYVNKRGAYRTGGQLQKADFLTSKKDIIDALDGFAVYVDGVALGSESVILLGGFVPTKVGSTEGHIPDTPVRITLKRGATTELFAECEAIQGAMWYGCVIIAGQPLPSGLTLNAQGQLVFTAEAGGGGGGGGPAGPPFGTLAVGIDLTKARKKHFLGLAPHITYYVYFFASNATGVSRLSDGESLEVL